MIFSVAELNEYIKGMFDADHALGNVFVRGEISNYKAHSSGHHYLSLKDDVGVIRAVMFRGNAQKLRFRPENGMKVIAHGRVTTFVRDGSYQLYIDDLTPDGVGALYVAFEQLKQKLNAIGLFDPNHKKVLPRFPVRIGIVTSPTGAAIRDMLRILSRRYPLAKVILYPVRVQGEDAPSEIAEGIAFLNHYKLCDVIITGRGGGSIEDLWAFNDERVAYAIYQSEIPIISAVGHEPDVTIADFTADVRAATPSNAAELVVPDAAELRSYLSSVQLHLIKSISYAITLRRQHLKNCASARVLQSPQYYLQDKRMLLEHTNTQFVSIMKQITAEKKQRLLQLVAKLDALSPLKVMSRGFSLVTDKQEQIVTDSATLHPGDSIRIRFLKGQAFCTVTECQKGDNQVERRKNDI